MGALARAAEVRAKRADVKRSLKAGESDPVEALEDPVMQRALASEFIHSLPGIGDKKCDGIMRALGISSRKRVGGLGRHQRAALKAYLEAKHVDQQD